VKVCLNLEIWFLGTRASDLIPVVFSSIQWAGSSSVLWLEQKWLSICPVKISPERPFFKLKWGLLQTETETSNLVPDPPNSLWGHARGCPSLVLPFLNYWPRKRYLHLIWQGY
jgi:hypothetical protein